jgi:ABC-type lipoprotein export system ATPase subunit
MGAHPAQVTSRTGGADLSCIIVTHDQDLAAKTDRIIRLKDGKVLSDETTAPAAVAV